MRGELIIMNSDSVNRKHMMFTIGALEDAAFDNATSGIPALVGHDGLRPIGWNFPFGLYFKPYLTRLVAKYQLAENKDDFEVIEKAYLSTVSNRYHEECEPHRAELDKLIENHKTTDGRYAGLGCAAFIDSGILLRLYSELQLKLDKDGLIKLSDLLEQFEYLGQGIFKDKKKNLAIFCHRFFRRSLSYINNFHFEFLDQFMSLNGTKDISLRIALDADVVGLASSFNLREELEYCWGPPYSDDIKSIKPEVTTYETDSTQKFFSGVSRMQFWWKNDDNLKVLEAEELRDNPTNGRGSDQYGCRYIHSIFEFREEKFQHFDGAIRMYSTDEMIERIGKEINKAGKGAAYTKLFRIDGKLSISIWKLLITYYYQGNPLTYEYFGMKQEHERLFNDSTPFKKNVTQQYMPYQIENVDGLRLFVSYHKPSSIEQSFDRIIINPDYSLTIDRQEQAIEFYALEIKKALNRIGEQLTIPDKIKFINVKDDFINFPTILHSTQGLQQKLEATISAYTLLFTKLSQRDVTIALTLAWPLEDKEVRLSIYGRLTEINKWLLDNKEIPVDYPNFRSWVEKQGDWLRKGYERKESGPKMEDLISADGALFIRRRQVEQSWLQFRETNVGLEYEISFPKDATELFRAFEQGELRPSLYYLVEKAHCSKTGEDYFTSLTSKALDDDVTCVITQAGSPSAFWTKNERPG